MKVPAGLTQKQRADWLDARLLVEYRGEIFTREFWADNQDRVRAVLDKREHRSQF